MRNLILVAATFLGLAVQSHAQNAENKNAISARLNFFDYGYFSTENAAKVSQGFELGYFRNVLPFVNLGVPFKVGVAKLPGKVNNSVTISADGLIQLQQMRSKYRISPFLFGGAGIALEEFKDIRINFPVGAGLNLRVSKYAYLSPQLEFRKALDPDRDNMNVGLGFLYLLHPAAPDTTPVAILKPKDTDGDGVLDFTDACPDEIGSAETFGCPDRDGDKVADNEDKCPDLPGKSATLGCPDSDNDGFGDNQDDCPDKPGKVNGCPDSDNDGFADKDDECPTLAGRWNGCPDSDFDGVADKDDKCPNDPGPATSAGCPTNAKDMDKDGVPDDADDCPTAFGTSATKGCPDKDGDGFSDKDDGCPDVSGNLKGCPDGDDDGFSDNLDKCPTQNGPINGCPDRDNDGWADGDDKCPDLAGKNMGCPDSAPDSDGDGIPDLTDPCPTSKGAFGGCPDSDNDGIADNIDKCPNSSGSGSASGCPEVKQEVRERLAFATKAVQFESGKAVLKAVSYEILDEIASIMKSYPDYKLIVSGHTDNQGNDVQNMNLSSERAKTCVDYLAFKGISASRMRSAGFGENRPIADNSNDYGRELNRRVEFEMSPE
jgi:OmpA-OmpF porin, OOP family